MEWQPIETAPKDGEFVLAYRNYEPYIEPMYYNDGRWHWFDGDSPSIQPTHWMPLPGPPIKSEGLVMTPEQMAIDAFAAIADGTRMTLVKRKGKKAPPRFPRGNLLCENSDGLRCYSYDPLRVLAWLRSNGLISIDVDSITPGARRWVPEQWREWAKRQARGE